MSTRLPRPVEWLLRAGLPSDQREPIAGDLVEGHQRVRERRGQMRADLWVWWEAIRACRDVPVGASRSRPRRAADRG